VIIPHFAAAVSMLCTDNANILLKWPPSIAILSGTRELIRSP